MRYSNRHFILFIFLLLAPLYSGDVAALKWVFLPLAIAAVFVKSGIAFPGLIIYATYSSNTYPVFLAMFLFSALNYSKLGRLKLLFLSVSALLPFVLWHVISKYLSGMSNIGALLNELYMYFTLFGFFYGFIMAKRLTFPLIAVVITIIGFIHLLPLKDIPFSATSFLAMVLWITLIVANYKIGLRLKYLEKLILVALLFTVIFLGYLSFTIILSAVLSVALLLALTGSRFWRFFSVFKGRMVFVVIFALLGYAVNNVDVDNYKNQEIVEIRDVSSINDLFVRAKFKLFGDRAPIWKSVIDYFVLKPSWWIYDDVGLIELSHNDLEFEGGSHNLYLETIRRMGFLPGAFVILLFISFHLRAGEQLHKLRTNELSTVLFISIFAVNIIGSWSGNFPLLPNYAIIGMVLLGSMVHFGEEAKTNQLKL